MAGILVLGTAPVFAQASPAAAAISLPSGFRLVTEATGQAQYDLTDFAVLPDGSKYTTGKSGKVAWVSADQTTVRTIAQLPVYAAYDIGLIGITLAPDYATSGNLYFVHPHDVAGHQYDEIVRYTADNPANPTALSAPKVILDGINQDYHYHGAGTVLANADGTFYAGFGDESSWVTATPDSLRAQSIDDPHGKILRFDAQGRGVPGNPFYDAKNPSSWRSRIFVMGMRNPTRFTTDARTGHLYIGEVGWSTYEEVDVARGGENFGWPCYEGVNKPSAFASMAGCQAIYAGNVRNDPPLYIWAHNGAGAAAIGGIFYTGTSYPASYRGKYFFADYAQQIIRVIGTDISDKVTSPGVTFGTGLGGPVAVHPEVNGDLAFADILSGSIKRLRYEAGNRPPTAAATVTNDPSTLTVSVDTSASDDLDGDALTYSTTFGDGSAAVSGPNPKHTYTAAGSYPVSVTVTDPLGAKDTATMTVKPANHTPVLQVTGPPAGQKFAVGAPVGLTATATDAEDGTLTPRFTIVLQHCPFGGVCHAHPDTTVEGNAYSGVFTDHGGDTKMDITVSVTDADGATVSSLYEALPDVHKVTVVSPVPVLLNHDTVTATTAVAGESVTVDAPGMYEGRQFTGWSDGGANAHTLTMPSTDLVLTANFATEIDTKYSQYGGAAKLGAATSAETAFTAGSLAGGRYRTYEKGAILWSRTTGAHPVQGALYTHYWGGGTPAYYGFPTADEQVISGGYASYFERGREYWSGPTGAKFVKGAILTRYLALGGPSFGLPVSDELKLADKNGSVSNFTGTKSIFWSPATGAWDVQGKIRDRYFSMASERSCLGYPTSGQVKTPTGVKNTFARGWITYTTSTKVTGQRCG